eukprot:UN05890
MSYFSIGSDQVTNFGAANYLILCDDIKSRIYTETIPIVTNTSYQYKTITKDLAKTFECTEPNSYTFKAGISSLNGYFDVYNRLYSDNLYSFGISTYSGNNVGKFELTSVVFCTDDNGIVSHGTTSTSFDSVADDNQIYKKLITYEVGTCTNVKIWTGLVKMNFACNVVVWTENALPTSFELIIAVWPTENQANCAGPWVDEQISVDYVVFCSGF